MSFLDLIILAAGESTTDPVYTKSADGLTVSAKVSIAAAVITALSLIFTALGLLRAWRIERFKTGENSNKIRAKGRDMLYGYDTTAPIYVNPTNYYNRAELEKYTDSHGRKYLIDCLKFQTSDIDLNITDELIYKHKSYGCMNYNPSLYSQENKMNLINLKNFDTLVRVIDKSVSRYIDKRMRDGVAVYNSTKWYLFMLVINAKLRLIKRQLESLPTSEIEVKIPGAKGSLKFFYTFVIKDYSKLEKLLDDKDWDYSKATAEQLKELDVENDPVYEILSSFANFYEREDDFQFSQAIIEHFDVSMYLTIKWSQSESVLNMYDFIKNNRSFANEDEFELAKEANKNIKAAETMKDILNGDKWINSAEIWRHLRISSSSIKFDASGKAYYVVNDSEQNVFLMEDEPQKTRQRVVIEKRNPISKIGLFKKEWKILVIKFRRLISRLVTLKPAIDIADKVVIPDKKNKQEISGEKVWAFEIKPKKINLDKVKQIGNDTADPSLDYFNGHDERLVRDFLTKAFISQSNETAESITDIKWFKIGDITDLKEGKAIIIPGSQMKIWRPADDECLVYANAEDRTAKIGRSLSEISDEFPSYNSREYSLDLVKEIFHK